jgi:nucleoside-diphosphate-sugar epimerase
VRIAITGATGVIGRSVVPALVAAGHEVVALARTPEKADALDSLGATPVLGSLFDESKLVDLFGECDAVGNFATRIPIGLSSLLPRAWRANDRLRTEGVRRVVEAARAAGVRRLVQESTSLLYADNGDDWITEESLLDITRATEPASVAEAHVQDYACESRVGVALRFGGIVGDDELTRLQLRSTGRGRPIGLGRPDGWAHVIHTDDLGAAVLAAFGAPSGTYNVGAEPVRRVELFAGFAEAAGRESIDFVSPTMVRIAGPRVEPGTRSLRVSSDRLSRTTGWSPDRPKFDITWFDVLEPA